MLWPVRALVGPMIWAVAFSAIYAVHGHGCASDWPLRSAPIWDLQRFSLILLWLISLGAAGVTLRLPVDGDHTARKLIRAGDWIGIVATAFTLFPVLGLTSCGAP